MAKPFRGRSVSREDGVHLKYVFKTRSCSGLLGNLIFSPGRPRITDEFGRKWGLGLLMPEVTQRRGHAGSSLTFISIAASFYLLKR